MKKNQKKEGGFKGNPKQEKNMKGKDYFQSYKNQQKIQKPTSSGFEIKTYNAETNKVFIYAAIILLILIIILSIW